MNLQPLFEGAQRASRALNLLPPSQIDALLRTLSEATIAAADRIIEANAKDLARMEPSDPMYDRLMLNRERIEAIAADILNVASLPSPLQITLEESTQPSGISIRKVSVPFGVIGVIYEARPNVSFDVFSLCLKSANACILKGGHDAEHSNRAIAELIRKTLREAGVDENTLTLLPASREATAELLEAVGYVDLLIPRGSQGLINYVRDHARIPVIETGAGICHTYFDREGDLEIARRVVCNAKTRRVSVCNALDCLLMHQDRIRELAQLCAPLSQKQVVIYADAPAFEALEGTYPSELLQRANESSYGTEFLSLKMAIRTVATFDEAVEHITRYSSKHSEAIISNNPDTTARFERMIDAACVYVNTSTAFTDGAQFGFGAEIGISTQKLHARGPMALRELTSYKYLIRSEGATRP